jgi:hypothetical protein
MRSFDDLTEKLEDIGIKILRRSDTSDVDCYTARSLEDIEREIENLGLIITRRRRYFIECLFLAENRIIPIEIATTLFRGAIFRNFQIAPDFTLKYISDPIMHEKKFRILKSVLCLSRLNVILGEPPELVSSVMSETLLYNPYKKSVDRWSYRSKFLLLINNAKASAVIDRYISLIYNLILSYKASGCFAIVGPDGVGKSSLINELTTYDGLKTIYMGMRDFKSEKLIRWLQKIRYINIPIVHLIIYIEYWFRLIKSLSLRMRGFDVVFDRYPTFDYFVSPSAFDRALGWVLYKHLFPKPRCIFLLTAPSIEVTRRKDEMTIFEVDSFYERASAYSVINVKNTGKITLALATILKVYYGFRK